MKQVVRAVLPVGTACLMRWRLLLLLLSCWCVCAVVAQAQTTLPTPAPTPFVFFPGANYDPTIPTLKQIVGHDWGEGITSHGEIERYLEALQKAAPDRLKFTAYGRSWQGRMLYNVFVGAPETISRLDQIQATMQKLADPRATNASEANQLMTALPATVWLIHGVHGNEISSVDSALLTLYHLLAAQGDPLVDAVRREVLTIIDPTQNPDGRDRFVNFFRQTTGRFPDADLQSAEHNEPWPSGRVNHYLFDLNRDWFAQSQPETRGRTQTYLRCFPQVVADLHEMGTNSSYYFAPPALPWNPNLTNAQLEWLTRFGRNNGKWFDQFGFDYYTRENYDSFYPGYGEGWPMFHGAVGMTYEQASVRGLVARRTDETTFHYRDSVQHHFIASLATLENAAQNRAALLKYFYDYRRTAIDEAQREPVKEYIIPPGTDAGKAARLAGVLIQSGIEVRQAAMAFSNSRTRDYFDGTLQARDFPAGSYIVSLAQPAKRLIRTLMEKHTDQGNEFLDEQKRRDSKRQPKQFYDVTAWSLPLIFNQPCYVAETVSNAQSMLLKELPRPTGKVRSEAKLAYLIPWGTQAAVSALAELFRQNIRVHSTDKPLKLNGVDFPPGTLIIKRKDNPANLHQQLTQLAETHGVEVHATDSAWVEAGVNFGSNNIAYLPKPRLALIYNTPTGVNAVGWARYIIEQRFGYPVTLLRGDQVRMMDLRRYNVLIVPDGGGNYSSVFGDGTQLREWVQQGGVLITIGEASAWLGDDKVGLLSVKPEKRDKTGAEKKDERKDDKPNAKPDGTNEAKPAASGTAATTIDPVTQAIQPAGEEPPSATPGALVRVLIDNSHWLGFGYQSSISALIDSNLIFPLVKLNRGTNVGIYAPSEQFYLSGFMFDDARKQLPNKAYLIHARQGRGHVIAFAEDPNYRAFMDGLNVLFANALFLAAGH